MKNLVSIIIPVYNGEKFIKRCLTSLLEQTYENIEIIVINDGSKDNTLNILNKIKDRRLIIKSIPNRGVSNARNVGLKSAKGEFIMFVDVDDYLDSRAVELLHEIMSNNDVDIIRFNGYIENFSGNTKKIEFPISNNTIIDSKIDENKVLELINCSKYSLRCYCWLLFMRNNNIKEFNITLSYLEDKVFYIENLLNDKKILFIDKPLYYYIFNENSKTKDINIFYKNILDILDGKNVEKRILHEKNIDYVQSLDVAYGRLIMYRMDFCVSITKYNQFKKIVCQLFDNNKIKDAMIFDRNKLNRFKKIQYSLLNKHMYFSYYAVTKLKEIVNKRR